MSSYIEDRLYSQAFKDGVDYAIEKMYAFTEFNKRAFNKKLELAKKGKLNYTPNSSNRTNGYILDLAGAMKKGDTEYFDKTLQRFKKYQDKSSYDRHLNEMLNLRKNKDKIEEMRNFHF